MTSAHFSSSGKDEFSMQSLKICVKGSTHISEFDLRILGGIFNPLLSSFRQDFQEDVNLVLHTTDWRGVYYYYYYSIIYSWFEI